MVKDARAQIYLIVLGREVVEVWMPLKIALLRSPYDNLQAFSALMVLSAHWRFQHGDKRHYGEIGSGSLRVDSSKLVNSRRHNIQNYLDEEIGSDRLYPFDV